MPRPASEGEVVRETELEAPGASVTLALPDWAKVAEESWPGPRTTRVAVRLTELTFRTVKTLVTVWGEATKPRSIESDSTFPVASLPGVTAKWLESLSTVKELPPVVRPSVKDADVIRVRPPMARTAARATIDAMRRVRVLTWQEPRQVYRAGARWPGGGR